MLSMSSRRDDADRASQALGFLSPGIDEARPANPCSKHSRFWLRTADGRLGGTPWPPPARVSSMSPAMHAQMTQATRQGPQLAETGASLATTEQLFRAHAARAHTPIPPRGPRTPIPPRGPRNEMRAKAEGRRHATMITGRRPIRVPLCYGVPSALRDGLTRCRYRGPRPLRRDCDPRPSPGAQPAGRCPPDGPSVVGRATGDAAWSWFCRRPAPTSSHCARFARRP